jgi:hypothetical protein
MWRCHVVYESRPHSVIVTLGGHLYRIPEVVPTTVPPKKCRKVVSHTAKFSFFTICSKGEQKDTATTTALPQAPSIQQKQVDKAAEKCKDSFCTSSSHVSLIQVDIGGHPPFPNGSKQFSGNFGNLLFLAGFNFRGHFEGPNEGFSRSRFSMIVQRHD